MITIIITLILCALTVVGALTVGIWIGTARADRKHRKRTPSQPPENIDGLTRRAHNEGGSLVRKVSKDQVFFAPIGTDLNDTTQWKELGYINEDGLTLEPDTEEIHDWSGGLVRTEQTIHVTFEQTAAYRKQFLQLVFGIYRQHGDRPLIHKGGKP